VNEPDISPLAKRLAEENNVRWQELKGSGAGGKVVERDVLEYLARVMAGEEALDPTPEPVPEGMDAWPEEDVVAWKRDNGALDDLQAGLSASERVDDDLMLDADAPDDDDGELISEDIFLFDDGEPESEDVGNTIEEDALLISGDDDLMTPVVTSEAEAVELDEELEDELDALEALAAAPVDDAAALDDDLPDLFASGDDEEGGDDALFADAEDPLGVLVDDDGDDVAAFEMDDAAVADADVEAPVEATLEIDDVEDMDLHDGHLELPESEVDLSQDGADEPVFVADAEPEPALDENDPMVDAGANEAAAELELETSVDEVVEGEVVEAIVEEDGFVSEVGDEGDLLATEDTVDEAVADGIDIDAAVTAPVVTEALTDLPLVSHGALLRRHIDLTALAAAQLAVGRELGHDDPIAPTPFLVRAAAKALDRVEIGGGSLGVAGFDGGVSVNGLDDAATMPFTELIDAVAQADSGGDAFALVVADMSELEVDEAVLHLDAPVMILGRVLYDNQQGSYRSTLSLSGEIAPDRGGRLLARVAELLDAPVQLVM
jgi:hypothetical protein